MGNGRDHKDDLEYTADGIRDTNSDLGKETDPNSVQASMQEETAKAIHRLAAAVEQQTEVLEAIAEDRQP